MQFDDLAYFSRFGSDRGMPLPIVFHDQRPPAGDDGKDGQFQAVVIIPFEPLAPPVFRRDLQWDGVPRSDGTTGQLLQSAAVLLQLTVVLTINHHC